MNHSLFFFLLACRSDTEKPTLPFCEGARKVMYDPLHPKEMWSFPDDFYTKDDSNSPTGHWIDLSQEKAPWTAEIGSLFETAIQETADRSGFARLGSAVIRFTGPVSNGPSTAEESLNSSEIMWFDMSTDPPERIAFTTTTSEFQNQLILKPLKPLPPNAKQAIIVTNDLLDVDGNCISPADLMTDLLSESATEPFLGKQSDIQQVITALDLDPAFLSHVMTYTTHDDLQTVTQIAARIPELDIAWETEGSCEPANTNSIKCERTFTAHDFRTNGAIESTTPTATWSIPVQIWLPQNATAPYPTVIYGHGLNSSAQEARRIAEHLNSQGYAVVAIDAMQHGQHPSADPNDAVPALQFLGLNLSAFRFDSRGLRGNFDQSALDKLQLLRLIRESGDLDDDGSIDVDSNNILYYGVSLGGLMGPQLLANADIGAGVLFVAGGDLPVFTTDTTTIEGLDTLLEELIGPEDVFNRMIPLMQTGVDASDPAVWGAHVLDNRLDDSTPPDLLFPVCLTDDTVPPATAKALAHGLGIPHLAPALDEVPMLEVQNTPAMANTSNGSTAGYFQMDRISSDTGVRQSTHGNLNHSPEGMLLADHFIQTHLDGQAEIINPYEWLETPPLD